MTKNPHAVKLGSDICYCGDYRSNHKPACFCGCPAFRFAQPETAAHLASAKDLATWSLYNSHKPKNPAAVALGRKGGKANKGIPKPKSAENGKKGGRPKGSKKK